MVCRKPPFLQRFADIRTDGAGLAAGVFHHLLNKGIESPKVLGATHFHGKQGLKWPWSRLDMEIEIFESGFLAQQPSLRFGHMEIRVDTESSESDEQLTYLYKYRTIFGSMKSVTDGVQLPQWTQHIQLWDMVSVWTESPRLNTKSRPVVQQRTV